MRVSRDDFEAWKANPMTEWVMAALQTAAEAQRLKWAHLTWEQGSPPDPMTLLELRTRADSYRALSETTFEGWCEINGDNPEA